MPARRKTPKNSTEKENVQPESPRSVHSSKASNTGLPSPKSIVTPASKIFGTPRIFVSPARSSANSLFATPIRQRSDIQSDSRLRQIQLSYDRDCSIRTPSSDPLETKLVIWGTDVVLDECKLLLKRFVLTWMPAPEIKHIYDLKKPIYLQKIEEIHITREPSLIVDASHLKIFNHSLYQQLVTYPQEVIPAFDLIVNEIFFEKFPDIILEHQIQVRVMNVDRTKNMRQLNPDDIDQLINISGMVIRCSSIIPEMQEAFYQCYICSNCVCSEINAGRIVEPNICTNCNCSHSMVLVHNRSQYIDKQVIKIQESPEEMPPGQTPYNVVLYAHGNLVDQVLPGDRVSITGIYRAIPIKCNPRQRALRSVYKTYIDVIHFFKDDSARLRSEADQESLNLSKERIEEIKNLAEFPDIYDRLAASLAPSIFGNIDVKKGIILQLLGATRKEFNQVGRSHFRSEINILLCGDPGTSKSQILKYVYDLLPRGQYTSGKGSSAVGLTAYITRDPDTRQLVLQTGALVLSDNGICCIDEFDKMSESTRSVLHEVMEQQTLSIAKAGIICQLNARTSVLAAANPIKSKWDTKLTTISNIQLPHTLLSRFDLIFLILDHQSEEFDKKLALHLVSIYQENPEQLKQKSIIDLALLKDYLSYARVVYQPKLTHDAAEKLVQSYLEMRKSGVQRGSISAYPRQLESLIRLSEAHAKARLSNFVEIPDVDEAMRLYKEALMQSSTDPKTGMIDVNILAAGFSESDKKLQQELIKAIKSYLEGQSKLYTTHSYHQLLESVRKLLSNPISIDMFDTALHILQDDHVLSIGDNKMIRFIIA